MAENAPSHASPDAPWDDERILRIFEQTGALLSGHFILRSGLRSGHFFQCARVCERLDQVELLARELLKRFPDKLRFDTVLAPAMGGLVIGQEVARRAGARYLFAEKGAGDHLELRRNFELREGERVLVVEDVITRGGRVREALEIVEASPAEAVGVACLVDRSGGEAQFEVPLHALLQLIFPTYEPDDLPPELAAIPPVKPGS